MSAHGQGQHQIRKKNDRLYQKTVHETGCAKTHLVLELIEKEYKKHFDYIIIICPTLREN